jgi:hypothetical protein
MRPFRENDRNMREIAAEDGEQQPGTTAKADGTRSVPATKRPFRERTLTAGAGSIIIERKGFDPFDRGRL